MTLVWTYLLEDTVTDFLRESERNEEELCEDSYEKYKNSVITYEIKKLQRYAKAMGMECLRRELEKVEKLNGTEPSVSMGVMNERGFKKRQKNKRKKKDNEHE